MTIASGHHYIVRDDNILPPTVPPELHGEAGGDRQGHAREDDLPRGRGLQQGLLEPGQLHRPEHRLAGAVRQVVAIAVGAGVREEVAQAPRTVAVERWITW